MGPQLEMAPGIPETFYNFYKDRRRIQACARGTALLQSRSGLEREERRPFYNSTAVRKCLNGHRIYNSTIPNITIGLSCPLDGGLEVGRPNPSTLLPINDDVSRSDVTV